MTEFSVGWYKTKDGHDARVLCDDAPGIAYPLFGYVVYRVGHRPISWRINGESDYGRECDLVPPRKPLKSYWIGPDGYMYSCEPKFAVNSTHRIDYYADEPRVVVTELKP